MGTKAEPVADTKPEESTEEAKQEVKTDEAADSKDGKNEDAKDEPKKEVLKTKGQIDYENPKNNRKFDPTQREVSDDPDAIRKQVEFYFGDWNFPQDKFMWETAGGTENKPIPIAKIHSFKRMRSFQPYSAVVAALRDSNLLDVEGEEGEETVKRKKAYQSQSHNKSKIDASTIYAKGFGDETPTTQFDLERFFADFGEVKAVKLRRTDEGFFKGSVFVTFQDEETAKKFLESDPLPKWQDHDLKIMSKRAYCDEKAELIRQGKLEPGTSTKKYFEGRQGKGSRDMNNWKERRDNDQKNGFRGGRGGRGNGRGGRGGRGRGGRGGRDRRDGGRERFDRNAEREANGKREREDDGASGEPAAKKVDTKEAPAAAAES